MASKYLHLMTLMRNERRPRAELAELQLRKLKGLVDHAYANVRFYHRLFDDHGIRPAAIRTLDDLRRLPVIDKSDLYSADPDELLDRRIAERGELMAISTSGSSGRGLRFKLRKAQYLRPYLTNGRRIADTMLRITSSPAIAPAWFQRLGLMQERRISPLVMGADQQLALFRAMKPDILQGYPSCLSLMAKRIDEEGLPIQAPRRIFTDSELLTAQARQAIEKSFGQRVLDVFGSFETDNFAYECHEHRGYHVTSDTTIVEFLRDDGTPADPEEPAEVVCTVLDNHAMPFIRYKLHDVAAYAAEPCPCGRTFPLMSVVAGRSDDFVRGPDGVIHSPREVLDVFDSFVGSALREYQVRQLSQNQFEFRVVPEAGYGADAERRIQSAFTRLFPSAEIEIKLVSEIPRTAGAKHRALIAEAL